MNRLKCLASILACLLVAGAAPAAPPALINYQGVLRDASGDPRNGAFSMVFRFFDAQLLGSEMLVDTHSGPQAVTVSGGLFNAQLGGGLVAAGGGPTSFLSLDAMFGAKDEVWLEVAVNGETLTPRVRVISAAYALNASAVDGVDSGSFLRSDASDTYTSGTLTTAPGTVLDINGDMWLNGTLIMDADGPDGAQAIFFYNSGNPTGASIQWDDVNNRFYASNGLLVDGVLRTSGNATVGGPQLIVGANGPDQDQILAFYEDGAPQGEYLQWDNSDDMFHFSDDVRVAGDLSVSGDDLSMGGFGGETTQRINFFNAGSPTGESFSWDDPQDRFEMTDEVAILGPLRVGSTTTAPATYNTIGGGTPTSSDITALSDLFVAADLEVGSQIYLGATDYLVGLSPTGIFASTNFTTGGLLLAEGNRLILDSDGVNLNYLEYLDPQEQFILTTDLDIFGEISANTKNFVQNHPHDDSLSIVYTTLEGPEASVFTRGSGRLDNGVAVVSLDETFAWVAHPDLGLTASLTPRGGWADLFVESLTPGELVVRAAPGTPLDAAFDYLILGLRVGYEESPVVRPKQREAKLPNVASQRARIQARPDLGRYTPLSRYQQTERAVHGREVTDFSAGDALRQAVGVGKERPEALAGPATSQRATGARGDDSAPRADAHAAAVSVPRNVEDAEAARTVRPRSTEAVSPSLGDVAPGDVLTFDTSGMVRRANTAGDVTVVGIAMGQSIVGEDGTPSVPFAVSGIVHGLVDASYGAIRPGDLLVSSPTPGHAMRADAPRPGTILGKALESLDAGTGLVRVLMTLR